MFNSLIQNDQRREELLEHLQHAAHSVWIDLGSRPDPSERRSLPAQRRS